MTALEQRIQPNHSTRMITTIKVSTDILPQFKIGKK